MGVSGRVEGGPESGETSAPHLSRAGDLFLQWGASLLGLQRPQAFLRAWGPSAAPGKKGRLVCAWREELCWLLHGVFAKCLRKV